MQLYNLIHKINNKEENENKIIEIKESNNNNEIWIKNCVFNLANNTYLFFDLN